MLGFAITLSVYCIVSLRGFMFKGVLITSPFGVVIFKVKFGSIWAFQSAYPTLNDADITNVDVLFKFFNLFNCTCIDCCNWLKASFSCGVSFLIPIYDTIGLAVNEAPLTGYILPLALLKDTWIL